jgi:molybdate transport system ATP-binding protein
MRPRLSIALHAVSVRRGGKWALREVSWQLEPGERWALLGDNGAGKTQLLKLLSGAVWPTPADSRDATAARAARIYRRGGEQLELIEAKPHMAYIGGELQDKYARYGWNLPVHALVATGLHGTDLLMNPITAHDAAQVAKVLNRCGLRRYARREFLTLSYGEKRLALLARALVQDPDWLLLDELYNGLDRHYRRRIDAVLDAARRRGTVLGGNGAPRHGRAAGHPPGAVARSRPGAVARASESRAAAAIDAACGRAAARAYLSRAAEP